MNVAEKSAAIAPETLIGKRIAKLDAPEKASGQTRYVHDLDLPGQLHAKILRSTRVHALIRRIDVAKARALPGVHAVLTAADATPEAETTRDAAADAIPKADTAGEAAADAAPEEDRRGVTVFDEFSIPEAAAGAPPEADRPPQNA